jgi:hypothetical protein
MEPRLDDFALLRLATAPVLSHAHRALRLLSEAGLSQPGAQDLHPADWPLGQRDAALMRLRIVVFGAQVPCVETCHMCRAIVELDAPLGDVLAMANGRPHGSPHTADPLVLSDGPCKARPLTTSDLIAAVALPPQAARRGLAKAASGLDLTNPEDIDKVEAWLDRVDPLAHIDFDLDCAACGARWQRPFDIVSVLWAEATAAGRRLIDEIDLLARAYHWSEADILAVPPDRRALYLQRVMG